MSAELSHTCLFTNHVQRLAEFYGKALNIKPVMYGDGYAEVQTSKGTLSFYNVEEQNEIAPGSAQAGPNRAMILEFHVSDVDVEYNRLVDLDVEVVKGPTTQVWGNRSFYFRDVDGNLVNFYSRVNGGN